MNCVSPVVQEAFANMRSNIWRFLLKETPVSENEELEGETGWNVRTWPKTGAREGKREKLLDCCAISWRLSKAVRYSCSQSWLRVESVAPRLGPVLAAPPAQSLTGSGLWGAWHWPGLVLGFRGSAGGLGQLHCQWLQVWQVCSYGHFIVNGTDARNPGLFYLEFNYPTGQLGLGMEAGTDLGSIHRSAIC